jgi:hypothetical protein
MTRPRFVTLAEQYLALRRSLGFALVTQGRLLIDFARFAAAEAGEPGAYRAGVAELRERRVGQQLPQHPGSALLRALIRGAAADNMPFSTHDGGASMPRQPASSSSRMPASDAGQAPSRAAT